jgi:hypothetical protein
MVISFKLMAENHIVYLGAGGEPEGDETIFDNGAKLFVNFYQRNKDNYKAIVAFNGEHGKTDALIRKGFKNAEIKENFSKENYQSIVSDLITKINSNPPRIKPGEKIMLMIDTHGAEKKEGFDTHDIALTGAAIVNYNEGSDDASSISLDSLKELTRLVEEKGINLAIIDGSCHSGNSLALANSKTCVISGSAPNQYATNFTDHIASKMSKGKTLEQAYLDARLAADPTPFPMISSPVGQLVQKDLEAAIPFLFYHEEESSLDKIDSFMMSLTEAVPYCKRENDFLGLKQFFGYMRSVLKANQSKSSKFNQVSLKRLETNIQKYKKVQDEYVKAFYNAGINQEELETEIEMNVDKYSVSYPLKDLLTADFDRIIKNAVFDLNKASKPEDKTRLAGHLELYQKLKVEQQKRLQESRNSKYLELQSKLKRDTRLQETAIQGISKDLMGLYHEYYLALKKELGSKNNPCAEFKI